MYFSFGTGFEPFCQARNARHKSERPPHRKSFRIYSKSKILSRCRTAGRVTGRVTMDAFSEILGGVALKGAMFFSAEFSAPWGFAAPHSQNLAPLVASGAPHLVIYHFLVEGSGLIRMQDGSSLRLEAGDVIVLPHGDPHGMFSAEGARDTETSQIVGKLQL